MICNKFNQYLNKMYVYMIYIYIIPPFTSLYVFLSVCLSVFLCVPGIYPYNFLWYPVTVLITTSQNTLFVHNEHHSTYQYQIMSGLSPVNDAPDTYVTLTVQRPQGQYLSAGHPVHSTCSAKTGAVGRLSWMLLNSSGLYRVDPHDPRFKLSSTTGTQGLVKKKYVQRYLLGFQVEV